MRKPSKKNPDHSFVKVAELLPGIPLDRAIAKAIGWERDIMMYGYDEVPQFSNAPALIMAILEREGIDLYCNLRTNPEHADPAWRGSWRAKYHRMGYGTEMVYAPTASLAVIRALLLSKFGEGYEMEFPNWILDRPNYPLAVGFANLSPVLE